MSLPRAFFVPSFRSRRLGLYFAALVGIMVYLATFIMVAEAALSAVSLSWDSGMSDRLTVELPPVGEEAGTSQAERVRQVSAILRAVPEIETVRRVPDEDIVRLLKPWFDRPEALASLPVPALLDVTRKAGSALTADDLRQKIKSVASTARVDDHAAWIADLAWFARGLAVMGGTMIAMTGLALIIAVSLLCRVVMAAERETIALLHIMGAEDNDIARHFEFHARRLSIPAAGAGFALAFLCAGAMLWALRRFADDVSVHAGSMAGLLIATTLVPIAAVAIAAWSARRSALAFLYTMP